MEHHHSSSSSSSGGPARAGGSFSTYHDHHQQLHHHHQHHSHHHPTHAHAHTHVASSSASSSSTTAGSRANGGPSSRESSSGEEGSKFDLLQWYAKYKGCVKYFVDHSQHTYPCQALAAFINIRLPFQRSGSGGGLPPLPPPLPRSAASTSASSSAAAAAVAGAVGVHPSMTPHGWVSLYPYIRRLVATGFDKPEILHGWFGDDWAAGVAPLHEQERRNFMFAAKSGGWAAVKSSYDVGPDEFVPYLKPLGATDDTEISLAESVWSKWLCMEDWMLGTRAPDHRCNGHGHGGADGAGPDSLDDSDGLLDGVDQYMDGMTNGSGYM